MDKYLYMVNPRIPLHLCGEVIRKAKNLELDKEEVKYALKHGPVYRKFDAQTMERVTLLNLDEMHVEKKGMVVEEVKVEDVVTPIQEYPVKDEVVKVSEGETPVVDTVKEKTSANEQVTEEVPVEEVKEEEQVTEEVAVEEVKEEEQVTEETSTEEQKQPQNNNYYRKKKRNR